MHILPLNCNNPFYFVTGLVTG